MISVGIDVSKEKSMVCILRPYGEVITTPYEVAHTESCIGELVNHILSLDGETRVVMEATGAYHLPLLCSLKEAGIYVSVINPLVMKKYASAAIRKGKTDKMDAVRIANYGIDNWFHLVNYTPPEETYDVLRLLGRQYAHYIKMRINSKLALTNMLDQTMPGIKKLLSGKRSENPVRDKLSDFVEEYWHYDNITRKTESSFVSDYCRWAKKEGYHANESKEKAIYAMARDGIPTLPSSATPAKMLVLEAVRILHEVNKTLLSILTQMQAIAEALPEYGVVREMPGVGVVLAPRLWRCKKVPQWQCLDCLCRY